MYIGLFCALDVRIRRGVQKVSQLDILDWKTFQNLYISKTYYVSYTRMSLKLIQASTIDLSHSLFG